MQTYISKLHIQMYKRLFANTNRQSKIIEQNWHGGITMSFRHKCEHTETRFRSLKFVPLRPCQCHSQKSRQFLDMCITKLISFTHVSFSPKTILQLHLEYLVWLSTSLTLLGVWHNSSNVACSKWATKKLKGISISLINKRL